MLMIINILIKLISLFRSIHAGQSNSSGVNIVAVIISAVLIVLIICLSMPICIICLVIALICTCKKYKKTKQATQAAAVDISSRMNDGSRPSIHHLPLPPIPTDVPEENAAEYEYASELRIEANQAYGTNMVNNTRNQTIDSNFMTEANRAYGSTNLVTGPNKAYELNSTTEAAYQAYELDDLIMDGNTANNSNLRTEENRAYGSKLSGALPNNEAAASQSQSTVPSILTDENIAYGQNQLAEESEMYEYI